LESPDNLNNGGFIRVDDFENMIDKYGSFIEVCGLSGGEALLHPEIGKLLEITKKHKLRTDIATNGILIKNKIDILREYLLDTLSVSMDGYDYKTFKKYRGGTVKQFDSILEGLYLLRKHGINFVLSFMLTSENIGEIGKMVEFACQVKPKAVGFHNINPHGDKRFTSLTVQNTKCMQILENIVSFADYPFNIELPIIFDTNSKQFQSTKCSLPWNYCVIDHNGNIAPCCQLMHSEEYGNIFKGYDFNSDKIRKFRRTILSGVILIKCLYCQRRFMGDEYGMFDAKSRSWILK
jgi:radical SAM protein with 4Fe4S-binding SPASM domain